MEDGIDDLARRVGTREVGRDGERVPACVGDCGAHRIETTGTSPDESDLEPLPGEKPGRGLPDSGAGPRDDGDAPVQPVRRYYDPCASPFSEQG